MENETTEETELTPPYYMTSSLGYQQKYIENAEDELASATEGLRTAARDLRHAELRNTIAVANLEKTKMDLQATQDSIANWIVDERKRLARKAIADAAAAAKAEQVAAEAAACGDEEPADADEDEDEGGVDEPDSVRTLSGTELGNSLDTGFTDDGEAF